jgi:putative glutamine amidotransferase
MKKIAIPLSESESRNYVNTAYIEYIRGAGFLPIPIPFITGNDSNSQITPLLEICDGLLLPGGVDLDPIHYGKDNYSSMSVSPEKDEFERELFYYFLYKDLPIFGICRGFQLICAELIRENKLSAYLSQGILGHKINTENSVSRSIPTHFVTINSKILYNINNIERMSVNSMHHQGVVIKQAYLSEYLNNNEVKVEVKVKVVAYKDYNKKDGLVLIEGIKYKNVLAVQWHPEELMDTDLLTNLF